MSSRKQNALICAAVVTFAVLMTAAFRNATLQHDARCHALLSLAHTGSDSILLNTQSPYCELEPSR